MPHLAPSQHSCRQCLAAIAHTLTGSRTAKQQPSR